MSETLIVGIEKVITSLRQLVQLDIQHHWYFLAETGIQNNFDTVNLENARSVLPNEKGYLIFSQGKQTVWLQQKITIPQTIAGYPLAGLSLRLVLTWWAEDAQIFVNGELKQQGDLFDSSARILLTDNAIVNNEYKIAIRLLTPQHDIGALMRSHLIYERVNNLDPGLVADELAVLLKYTLEFEPDNLEILATEINKLDWNNITNADRFDRDLAALRQRLLPLAKNIKQRRFNLLGHAHLDMAWLWTTAETYEVAQRTFNSVLDLQQNYPHLTFGHTTPALYEWLEHHRPELFKAVRDAVKQGKWEVLGGMWVEPELNLVSGESLIRQLLYGQKYFKDKFGDITRVAWLPDSFGFTWQLPQIFQQSGIDYFVTGKLHWNDTNKFPLGCFWWESPDGTRLLTLMSPPNVTGVMDTNPMVMSDYAVEWECQTGLQEIFWLPGVGDHGGGPTKDMLDVAAKWDESPFFPEIKFTTASEYLAKINRNADKLPLWQDELYLELHRGCYTTHADQKKFNRYCETLLYEAELWATIANLVNPDWFARQAIFSIMYNTVEKTSCQGWQQHLETAWKKVLFNQFHDILPGTSIPEVFTEANKDWETAIEIGENTLSAALKAVAECIALPSPPYPDGKPLVIFNSLNWKRSEIVEIETSKNCQVYDYEGNKLRSQFIDGNKLLFLAKDIPSVGYRLFWLVDAKEKKTETNLDINLDYRLENEYLKVAVNSQTGDLDSTYDKVNQREILSGAGNKLQAFTDKGQYWDAWNIDPDYEQYPLPNAKLESIQWLDQGKLQQRIRVIKTLGKSQFVQDYILQINSPILKITNYVDWQETNVVVKTAFPLNIESDRFTREIACGAIEHPTKPETELEKAKWEVAALKWVDLTDNSSEYGVSLLNDCKHGHDFNSNRIRLTLLRSPLWPDPTCDRSKHQFTYAIYPHQNDWREAKTVQKSYELNVPLQKIFIDNNKHKARLDKKQLFVAKSFLNLSAENLILTALKPNERNTREVVIRFYECCGKTAKLSLQNELELNFDCRTNILEEVIEDSNKAREVVVIPWQIMTFKTVKSFYNY
ncbi:alpha-mannosidase [Myxosarcina sp. GI1]|uniref:alpha-mannosidase n=1 Tax=Myxosarcina sp. GI1 TaxID=1541065 RepID=UPI0009DCD0E1|nr:alpha-mannosidase [Myxosarcina sp. GI1]